MRQDCGFYVLTRINVVFIHWISRPPGAAEQHKKRIAHDGKRATRAWRSREYSCRIRCRIRASTRFSNNNWKVGMFNVRIHFDNIAVCAQHHPSVCKAKAKNPFVFTPSHQPTLKLNKGKFVKLRFNIANIPISPNTQWGRTPMNRNTSVPQCGYTVERTYIDSFLFDQLPVRV